MRLKVLAPWLVLAALVGGYLLLVPPTGGHTAVESAEIGWDDGQRAQRIAHDLHERLNDERAERGLPALEWHDGLAEQAQDWTRHMIEQGEFEHSPVELQRHPDFMGTGENILMGHDGSADGHVAWMESDGHREAILYPHFTAVGIGAICRNDGRLWATQLFGVAHGPPPSDVAVDTSVEPIVRDDGGIDCPNVPRWDR